MEQAGDIVTNSGVVSVSGAGKRADGGGDFATKDALDARHKVPRAERLVKSKQ